MSFTLYIIITNLLSFSNHLKSEEPDSRIYKGFNCSTETYRFFVAIFSSSPTRPTWKRDCGGSLLNAHWVLTAAHCINVTGNYGVKYQLSFEPSKLIPAKAYPHPKYTSMLSNDIGFLRLETPVEPSRHVGYVKMPSEDSGNDDPPCQKALIMGLGIFKPKTSGEPHDKNLQCVHVPVISYYLCKEFLPMVQAKCLCTYSPDKRDSCSGDSGGPVMCGDTQVGIVSFGPDCGVGTVPTVHAKVDRYLDLIHEYRALTRGDRRCFVNENVMFGLVFFSVVVVNI